MSKYTITPWRTQSDLLAVRQQLYSTDEANPNTRRNAVDRIMAWKLRGNLPHAVESTALLVEAILHHDVKTNSIFSIRAVYSAAFSRFVTGFCDIGRHKERSLEPSSMLDIARQIGMPVEFVALRHEATHEELPGIRRLVGATREALDWLWKVYWSRLEEREDEGEVQAALVAMKTEAASILREFRRARRDALRSKSRPGTGEPGDVLSTSVACAELCKRSRSRIEALAAVMVEERLLLPSNRELGSPMDGAYLIWDDLVLAIFSRVYTFMPALVRNLLQALTLRTGTEPENDTDKEALSMWLLHMVDSSSVMLPKDRAVLFADAMKWCCLHPGHWTQHIGRKLLAESDESVQDEWGDLFEASLITPEGEPMEEVVHDVNPSGLDDLKKGDFGGGEESRAAGGWSRAITPMSVPMGVVQ